MRVIIVAASRALAVVMILGLALALGIGTARAEEQWIEHVREFTLDPGGELRLQSFAGEARITGWDSPMIEVRYYLKPETKGEVSFRHEGNRLEVIYDPWNGVSEEERGFWFSRLIDKFRNIGNFGEEHTVKYEIRMPRATALQVDCAAGRVDIDSIGSSLHLDMGAGKIRAGNIGGNLNAELGAGEMNLNGITGEVRAEVGVGRLELWQAGLNPAFTSLDVGVGQVVIYLSPLARAELRLEGMKVEIQDREVFHLEGSEGGDVKARIGGGGALIQAEVGVGQVVLASTGEPVP